MSRTGVTLKDETDRTDGEKNIDDDALDEIDEPADSNVFLRRSEPFPVRRSNEFRRRRRSHRAAVRDASFDSTLDR